MKPVFIAPVIVFLMYTNFIFSSYERRRSHHRTQSGKVIPFRQGPVDKFLQKTFLDFSKLEKEDFSMLKIAIDKYPKKAIENLRDKNGKTVLQALLLNGGFSPRNTCKTFCKCVESAFPENSESLYLKLPKEDAISLLRKIDLVGIREKYVEFLIGKKYFSREEAQKYKLIPEEKKEISFPAGWQ